MKHLGGSRGRTVAAGVLLVPLLLGSCREQSPLAPGDAAGARVEFGQGAVRLSLEEGPWLASGQRTYTLRLLDPGALTGSYQGSIRFPAGGLELLSVRVPDVPGGEFRVVNHESGTGGVIRFAAYSLNGFSSAEVLTLIARPRVPLAELGFAARLDVAADRRGEPIALTWPATTPGSHQLVLAANNLGPDFIGLNMGTTAALRVEPGTKVALPAIVNIDSAGGLSLDSIRSRLNWQLTGALVDALSFDSIRSASIPQWTISTNISTVGSGYVTFTGSGTVPLGANSTMVTAYFTASAEVLGTMVTLEPVAATNPIGTSILTSVRPRNLALCVAPTGSWGDANDDGDINVIDAQQIARHSAGLSVLDLEAVTARGDVTDDDAVNIIDAQQVARFSVGLSAAPRTGTPLYTIPATTILNIDGPTTLAVGTSVQFDAHTQAGGDDTTGCASVTWTTSNPAVAVVNATGLVSGIGAGSATITAHSDGVSTPPVTVTVTQP